MAQLRVTAARLVRILGVVLVVTCLGCGDGREASSPSHDVMTSPPEAGTYELDVIAEADPDEGPPPLTVRFVGYVEEEQGGPWRYHWDFGDGTGADERNVSHTYQDEGDYTAVLTATDQDGNTGSDEIDVFVERAD